MQPAPSLDDIAGSAAARVGAVSSNDITITPIDVPRGESLVLHGDMAGHGATILALHGLTATRRYVFHGSRVLERAGFKTIAYDARGHGQSGGPHEPGEYTYDHLVADAIAVLDHHEIDRAVLAGHSMGTATAAATALQHPERVSALVLVGPAHRGAPSDNQPRWDALANGLAADGVEGFMTAFGTPNLPGRLSETVLKVVRQRLSRHEDMLALSACLSGVTRTAAFDGLAQLEKIDVPTLVVGSRDDSDPDHPLSIAETYAARIPGAGLIVEGAGESPLAWRGGTLSKAVLEFLSDQGIHP